MDSSIMQRSILKYIDQNFEEGSVRKELVGDSAVRITDRTGASMTFTQNLFGDIMDYNTKKVLAISDLPHNLDELRTTAMPTKWTELDKSTKIEIDREPTNRVTYFVSHLNSEDESWSPAKKINCPDFESAMKKYIDAGVVNGKRLGMLIQGEEYVLAKFDIDTMKNQFDSRHSLGHPISTEEHTKLGDNLKILYKELAKDNAYHALIKDFARLTERASGDMVRQNSEWGSWFGRFAVDGRPQDYIEIDITGYSKHHKISFDVNVVRENEYVAFKQIMLDTDPEAFRDSIRTVRRAAHRELDEYLRDAAGMLETKLEQPFTFYSHIDEHTMDKHYELLGKAGYENFPTTKGDTKMVNEEKIVNESINTEPRRYTADEKGNVSRTWHGKTVEEFSKEDTIRFTVETDIKLNGKLSQEVKDMLDREGYSFENGELKKLPLFAYEEQVENAYKGFAYIQGNSRPTILTGPSREAVLERVQAWNLSRPDKVKYSFCNIGVLDQETGKYGSWEKYDVGTGRNISNIYLKLPRMSKEEFENVKAYLKENGARFSVEKKQWYISPDKVDKFKDYLPKETEMQLPETKSYIVMPKMSKETFEAAKEMLKAQGAKFDWTEKKWFSSPERVEELQRKVDELAQNQASSIKQTQVEANQKVETPVGTQAGSLQYNPLYLVSGLENPYIIHLVDGSAMRIEQEEILSLAGVKSYPEMNNALIVNAIEKALKERMQVLEADNYYISIKKEMGENKCSICYKEDVSKNFDIYGDSVGLHFPSASEQEILDAVHEYIKSREAIQQVASTSELSSPGVGEKISGYRGIQRSDAQGYQCIGEVEKVEGILNKIVVDEIHPDKSTYFIQNVSGKMYEISSREWFTNMQGNVLLRAMKDGLQPDAFDLVANPRLDAAQMEVVRNGLKDGLTVEAVAMYADPKLPAGDMDLYRYGMEQGLSGYHIGKVIEQGNKENLPWEDKRKLVDVEIKTHRQSVVIDLQKHGFHADTSIMNNIVRLNQLTQRENTIQDICKAFKEAQYVGTPTGTVIEELGKAFQQQESMKMMAVMHPEM